MSIGSISGNLLSQNLLRNGENLAFETKLLYLDVVNGRVGFNNSAPVRELTTNWLTTDYLITDNFTVGNISFSPDTIQDFVSPVYITPDQTSNPQIIATGFGVSGFSINNTSILGNLNHDIIFQADALGNVQLNTTQLLVNANLHATGIITADGSIQLGNNSSDTIAFVADVNSDITPNQNKYYNLGTSLLRWKNIYGQNIDVNGVTQITGNTISTSPNLVLTSNGGVVRAASNVVINSTLTAPTLVLNSTQVNGLLTVNNNISRTGTTQLTGNIIQTGNTSVTGSMNISNLVTNQSSLIQTGDYQISNNTLSTINTNENVVLNSTGNVSIFNTIQFNNNQIINTLTGSHTDNEKSIIFNPSGTGNVVINTTKPLQIPYNNDSTYLLSHTGQIRQNSTTNFYEGWAPSGTVSFYQLYSSDRKSYIIPELTPYSGDNILRFAVNNVVTTTIDTSKIYNTAATFGNVSINQNSISNVTPSIDITINPVSSSNSIYVNGLPFNQNTILNPTNGVLTLATTGTGYVKFGGTFGVVLPNGTTSQQPSSPDVGTMRFNTNSQVEEVWNGTAWVGSSAHITLDQVTDIMDIWSIILG